MASENSAVRMENTQGWKYQRNQKTKY